jgi:hypothetical protein
VVGTWGAQRQGGLAWGRHCRRQSYLGRPLLSFEGLEDGRLRRMSQRGHSSREHAALYEYACGGAADSVPALGGRGLVDWLR